MKHAENKVETQAVKIETLEGDIKSKNGIIYTQALRKKQEDEAAAESNETKEAIANAPKTNHCAQSDAIRIALGLQNNKPATEEVTTD